MGGGGRFIGSFMEELGAKIYQEHVIFNQLMKKNTLIKRGVSLPFIENTKNEGILAEYKAMTTYG